MPIICQIIERDTHVYHEATTAPHQNAIAGTSDCPKSSYTFQCRAIRSRLPHALYCIVLALTTQSALVAPVSVGSRWSQMSVFVIHYLVDWDSYFRAIVRTRLAVILNFSNSNEKSCIFFCCAFDDNNNIRESGIFDFDFSKVLIHVKIPSRVF